MTRRFILLAVLVVMVLSACGGGSPRAAPTVGPATGTNKTTVQATAATGAFTATGKAPTAGATEPQQTSVAEATGATTPEATSATGQPQPMGTTSPDAAQQSAYPLTYKDTSGTTVTIKEQPRRIISLFPTNNDTLFTIGAGDQVIAVDDFTHYPDEADQTPKIGGGNNFKFNVERMVSLRPDLVLTSFGTEDLVDKPLRKAGVTVISLPYPSSLKATYKLMTDLGRISGHPSEAQRLVSDLQKGIQNVRQRAGHAGRLSVYYESDISTPGKPFTVGPGSLTDELIAIAGGRNVFHGARSTAPQVGYEAIVAADPQVIILGDAKDYVGPGFLSPTTPAEVQARKGFKTTRAVQDNRVIPVNIELLSPGPRLSQGVRDLAVAMHPEVFGER